MTKSENKTKLFIKSLIYALIYLLTFLASKYINEIEKF